MIGRNRSRWQALLVIAACLAVPLLAVALLLGAAEMETERSRSGEGKEFPRDEKRSKRNPVSIKVNSWVDVLRTFYLDSRAPQPASQDARP